jgi:hypothetical protein
MINDTIDIQDGKVVNFGIDFSIIVHSNENRHEVLNRAIRALQSEMSQSLYIGEPLYLTDIYGILNRVSGVADTRNVRAYAKTGTRYSSASFDFDTVLSVDGLTINTPLNVALEIKYPSADIKGSIA